MARRQGRDVMTYFHELRIFHKRHCDLTLSKCAMEFIEQDYMNVLQPIEIFEPRVPAGRYLASDERLE
jgi:hypothetical protein